jgi:SAM-dependent methyltransferase
MKKSTPDKAQYQSFPDATGDSRTLDKLKALKLPNLDGRTFLDVGCNEGFFCGFAKFLGARRVVGLDHSRLFIERAQQRFPDCEFHHQGWDLLPEGPFDVILLASALHYAEDQPGLLRRLVERLSDDGVLVLEMGIVSSQENAWIEVERGIDRRSFPTMPRLREVLDDYAWKWMGRSVTQDGDPVGRHVVHVSRRRPVAYLLMQPPAYGKSSIAAGLFPQAGIPVVSGDQKIADIAQGKQEAPAVLREAITRGYSPFRIDEAVARVFAAGLGAELVAQWTGQVGKRDFALDAFVPPEQHAQVEAALVGLGYLPVQLRWDRVGPSLLPAAKIEEHADAFYRAMGMTGAPRPAPAEPQAKGFVDRLGIKNGVLNIRGWVVDAAGGPPSAVTIRFRGQDYPADLEVQARPDVQRHLGLENDRFGFLATVRLPGVTELADLAGAFDVVVPHCGRVPLAKALFSKLRRES